MATRLMNLRNAGDDEIDEMCLLLEQHGIEAYVSAPGPWGISAPALWVSADDDAGRARELIADYQQQRGERVRAEYRQLRQQGLAETFVQRLRRRPVKVLLVVAVIALILYLMLKPFVDLARGGG